jgi:hypothetical protein
MFQAVGRIRTYTNNLDQAAFERDIRTQDAVIRNLEILGEAARNVQVHDSAYVTAHPEIPWRWHTACATPSVMDMRMLIWARSGTRSGMIFRRLKSDPDYA